MHTTMQIYTTPVPIALKSRIYFIFDSEAVIKYQIFNCLAVRSLGHVAWNQAYMMVVVHDIMSVLRGEMQCSTSP